MITSDLTIKLNILNSEYNEMYNKFSILNQEFDIYNKEFDDLIKSIDLNGININISKIEQSMNNINNKIISFFTNETIINNITDNISSLKNEIELIELQLSKIDMDDISNIDFVYQQQLDEINTIVKTIESINNTIKQYDDLIKSTTLQNLKCTVSCSLPSLDCFDNINNKFNNIKDIIEYCKKQINCSKNLLSIFKNKTKKIIKFNNNLYVGGVFDPLFSLHYHDKIIFFYDIIFDLNKNMLIFNKKNIYSINRININNNSISNNNDFFIKMNNFSFFYIKSNDLSLIIIETNQYKLMIYSNGQILFYDENNFFHYTPCLNLLKIYDKTMNLISLSKISTTQRDGIFFFELELFPGVNIKFSMEVFNQIDELTIVTSEYNIQLEYEYGLVSIIDFASMKTKIQLTNI